MREIIIEESALRTLYIDQNQSINKIAKIYNVSPETVRLKFINYGINRRPAAHILKFTYDAHFFDVPNILNSYWAGFIAADGCISEGAYKDIRLVIALNRLDRNHLLQFLYDINGTNIIKDCHKPEMCCIYLNRFNSTAEQLKIHYNITPRKTKTLQPPLNLSKENALAFIKGYIDGDGCIRLYKNGNLRSLKLNIVGNVSVLQWIKIVLDDITNDNRGNIQKFNHCDCYSYSITGIKAYQICKFLRNIHTPCLERKWSKVNEIELYRSDWVSIN